MRINRNGTDKIKQTSYSPNPAARVSALTLFLLLYLVVPAFCDENHEISISERIDSLLEKSSSSDFFDSLKNTYHEMQDPQDALDIMYKFLPLLNNDEQRHTVLIDMARLEEQTGRLQQAQIHYQSAAFSGQGLRDFDALYHSVLLLIDLGDLDYALVQSQQIIDQADDTELLDRTIAQKARILQIMERYGEAVEINDQLHTRRKDLPADVLYSCWLIYSSDADSDSDSAKKAEELKQELKERFPGSPEYGLLIREHNPALTVEHVFSLRGDGSNHGVWEQEQQDEKKGPPVNPKEESRTDAEGEYRSLTVEAVEQKAEQQISAAIQTGSFRDAENAHYMQRALEEQGFTAMVAQAKVGQTVYYRVLVPIPFGGSQEQTILKLKEKGFEGYPVY